MIQIQSIRESVTAKQAAELYGLKFDRRGLKAVCPWHNDHSPSLSFKGSRCKCFACSNGGDSVDLTAQIFGIPIQDAAERLQKDFGVGVELDKSSRARAKAQQRARERAAEAERKRYIRLCDRERNSREALMAFDKETAWDNPRFRALLQSFARTQDTLNGWDV